MDWTKIPSLASLRAFEATARLGTFSAAARSLNVTHAAIAQHVRSLEQFFGADLVFRVGRRMDLTEAGTQLSASLKSGFSQIESGVRELAEYSGKKPIHVTLTPSFAENWLMPRLGGFWAEHPDIELILKPSTRLSDLRDEGLDIAIRYGNGSWPGYASERLTSNKLMVVGSPKLLGNAQNLGVKQLENQPWLLESQVSEHLIWAEDQGINFQNSKVSHFATNNLVLAATRAGYGISLQSSALVERDLAEGTLVKVLEAEKNKRAYYLVTQSNRQSPQLAVFVGWLRSLV